MAKQRKSKKLFFECPYCFAIFDDYEQYDLHLTLDHDEDRYLLDGDDDYYY